jgi:hypothetical protein
LNCEAEYPNRPIMIESPIKSLPVKKSPGPEKQSFTVEFYKNIYRRINAHFSDTIQKTEKERTLSKFYKINSTLTSKPKT